MEIPFRLSLEEMDEKDQVQQVSERRKRRQKQATSGLVSAKALEMPT
jgi:hypothetical protein